MSALFHFVQAQQASLSGRLVDAATQQPLAGASIYIPDFRLGTITDADGRFSLQNLPMATALVQVSMVGYQSEVKSLQLTESSTLDVALSPAIAELFEVVITGLSQSAERRRTPAPIATLSAEQLRRSAAANLIEAIAQEPGVNQVTTGAAISKPVIRGLGANRVVVVSDGIRQEGQQWGDEHGIEVDQNSVHRVEILKGPASLAYGSDALAGVVNLLPAPTAPAGRVNGWLTTQYHYNNGLLGAAANVSGNNGGVVWNIRASEKTAHAYRNRFDGYVLNSGFSELAGGAMVGVNKKWGYTHLSASAYQLQPGIVEGERDSATGKFIKLSPVGDTATAEVLAEDGDFTRYRLLTPFQKVEHYKLVSGTRAVMGNASLLATVGWQQNRRREFEDALNTDDFELYFHTNTINYDVRLSAPELRGVRISGGVNGMYQLSENRGPEFLIPNYWLLDVGAFAIAEKAWQRLNLSAGIRFDMRTQEGESRWLDSLGEPADEAAAAEQQFAAFSSSYSGATGSVGAAYQFTKNLSAKASLARGFRAPNISEISANGVHEGGNQYLIGNAKLKPEFSLQADAALALATEHVNAEFNMFRSDISNYIYLQKLSATGGGDSIIDGNQTFAYTAGNASLMGGEAMMDVHPHPLDWLHVQNAFSWVQARQIGQPDSMRYLPFIPAPRLSSELMAEGARIAKFLANGYVRVGGEYVWDQTRIYSAFQTETATPAYFLLNAGFGADVVVGRKSRCTIHVAGTNLADVAYQSHLSRLKYGPTNESTGRSGVWNMGRNFSLRLMVPLGW